MPEFPEIRKALRKAFLDAPTLTGSSLRQSRSLAGSFSSDSEVNAYKGIAFYIGDGILLHEDEIKHIIDRASFNQYDVRFSPYRFVVIPLNHKANKDFLQEALVRDTNRVRAPVIWKLFDQINNRQFADNTVFDGLYPSGNAAQEWLHLFFLTEALFTMTEAGQTALARTQYQKHSIGFVHDGSAEYLILNGRELYAAVLKKNC